MKRIGAKAVEIHTGTYAEAYYKNPPKRMDTRTRPEQDIMKTAQLAHSLGLEVHAGHGLNYDNVGLVAAIPEIVELNIGHFLIGEAVFTGLKESILKIRKAMNDARRKN